MCPVLFDKINCVVIMLGFSVSSTIWLFFPHVLLTYWVPKHVHLVQTQTPLGYFSLSSSKCTRDPLPCSLPVCILIQNLHPPRFVYISLCLSLAVWFLVGIPCPPCDARSAPSLHSVLGYCPTPTNLNSKLTLQIRLTSSYLLSIVH